MLANNHTIVTVGKSDRCTWLAQLTNFGIDAGCEAPHMHR